MVFLDDDPLTAHTADQADADRRAALLTSDQLAAGALEVDGLATQLAAKGISFGMTRQGFLLTMAATWDSKHAAYQALRRARDQQLAEQKTAAAAPEGT